MWNPLLFLCQITETQLTSWHSRKRCNLLFFLRCDTSQKHVSSYVPGDAMQQSGWVLPCCKENKAYYLSTFTGSGLLVSNTYVTTWPISPNGIFSFPFMSQTAAQPSLILYTGWRRAHQDNTWWMASKRGWRRQPMNHQCSGHHDVTQTYLILGL